MKFKKQLLLRSSDQYNNLSNLTLALKVTDFVSSLQLTAEQMRKMKTVFQEEMKLGALSKPSKKSSLLMMNTYITDMIDGSESGDFLALDLGSTNFRVCHLNMCSGRKEEKFDVKYYDIPEAMKKGKADPLFEHIAVCVKDFIENVLHYQKDEALPLAFTFSFPVSAII